MPELDALLRLMTDRGASDLHLKPMRRPVIRLQGKLEPLDLQPFSQAQVEAMLREVLSPRQEAWLEEHLAVDIAYGVPGVARFRGNIFMQRGSLVGSFRRIPYEIESLEDLDLPVVLQEITDLPMGLVLVTGPTGSGKSTTLAALIRRITESKPLHILTIEDPMEFLFRDAVATVSQREVGTDTLTFAEALRNAFRQDPDVIMVGEMRDPETIATVITAAETGHLVFSTLHTNSATQTVDRILDGFPAAQQRQVRAQLAQVLKAVVSMKLAERRDGTGLVAALEIMRVSPRIAELIEKGETGRLSEEVESSVSYHRMQSMNQSLLALLVHGTITYSEARRLSPDPDDLSLKLRRMFPAIEQGGDEMSPSTADFSEILELQEYRRLYEEQEERTRLTLAEKDQEVAELDEKIAGRDEQIRQLTVELQAAQQAGERLKSETTRVQHEAQAKVDKLSERIRELNRRLMAHR